jgi:uroporphyrinogen decarboxylase
LSYIETVLDRLHAHVGQTTPTIVFTKGGGQWLERIAATGCSGVGLDWTTDMTAARAQVGKRVALQGNLDPIVLLTTPEAVCEQARIVLDAAGSSPGHVFNLGHGITPTTPPENVAALVDFVHTESQKRLAPVAVR